MEDLYSEHILDHYANPRNTGRLESPDIIADADDPSCGDQVHLELALDSEGRVAQVAFEGEGCIVSMASASIFTEHILGKSLDQVGELGEEDVLENLDAPVGGRRRCALLAWETLRTALKSYHESQEA